LRQNEGGRALKIFKGDESDLGVDQGTAVAITDLVPGPVLYLLDDTGWSELARLQDKIKRLAAEQGLAKAEAWAMKEGLTKKEAFRCLKRYIAREVYGLLPMERLTA
jgi:hypothetical protein